MTISQGMLKKGDVHDDKVRTTVPSQNRGTVTLGSEEFFLRAYSVRLRSSHVLGECPAKLENAE
jgi:hypothetical protein